MAARLVENLTAISQSGNQNDPDRVAGLTAARVGSGLMASLNRPSRNVTSITIFGDVTVG